MSNTFRPEDNSLEMVSDRAHCPQHSSLHTTQCQGERGRDGSTMLVLLVSNLKMVFEQSPGEGPLHPMPVSSLPLHLCNLPVQVWMTSLQCIPGREFMVARNREQRQPPAPAPKDLKQQGFTAKISEPRNLGNTQARPREEQALKEGRDPGAQGLPLN